MHVILIYIGIFCGIFFEGEMVMITSVIAAHHGHLKLWIVIAVGLTGTYGSDCFYFFLGRKRGKDWLDKNPRYRDKYEVIDRKIDRYPILIFLVYRFMYGFRTVAPLAIGVSSTRTSKFLILSAISTLVWGVTYSAVGYISGEVLKTKFSHIEHIEKYVIGILLLVGLVVLILYRMRNKKKRPSSNKLSDLH